MLLSSQISLVKKRNNNLQLSYLLKQIFRCGLLSLCMLALHLNWLESRKILILNYASPLYSVFKLALHWFIQHKQNCVLNGGRVAWGCSGSQYEGSRFKSPGQGPCCAEFACPPCVCMDSLRVLQLPPTVQNMHTGI